MGRLHEWHANLPREWQLSELLVEDGGTYAKSSLESERLLLLHVLYQGTFIILNSRKLGAIIKDSSKKQDYPSTTKDVELVFAQADDTFDAAHLMARIFILLNHEEDVYRRCWLSMYVQVPHLSRSFS